ncbi:hypothetical protein BGZ49_009786 [Haplosporangium sp. Z 27]|nr:hypothetical protein BGZ49_009786 [Haplosporangium sp. Z 27]
MTLDAPTWRRCSNELMTARKRPSSLPYQSISSSRSTAVSLPSPSSLSLSWSNIHLLYLIFLSFLHSSASTMSYTLISRQNGHISKIIPFNFSTLYAFSSFVILVSLLTSTTNITDAALVNTPNSFADKKYTQRLLTDSTISPPVDFATLGQMAILGDFDALSPIVTSNQQNTFSSNTFSILELSSVPMKTGTGSDGNHINNSSAQADDVVLSAPVYLASFSIDNVTEGAPSQANGITTTCVLDHAPHQVYIGGYFKQSPSVTNSSVIGNSTWTNKVIDYGINYIGLYDSELKQFLSMNNGLDGPVEALLCDSSTDQVYVVGKFRAPLPGMVSDNNSSNSSSYQSQSSFGGGIAVWKRDINSKNNQSQSTVISQAAGSWISLPFKGLDGVVTSVVKAADGTIYFGGQFDTTADGEMFNAPDTQLVNMDNVLITTENGENPLQDRSIICQSSALTRGNWIMRDNMPGYWRAEFPLLITPTLFRLWNIDTTKEGSEGRGTKTFSIIAQPINQLLILSYIDPNTHLKQYCTTCTLLPWSNSTTISQGYQDFMVVNPILLHDIQIDIKSWYGQGGGLGGIEIYQAEIFVRSVDELNSVSPCSPMTTDSSKNDLTAFSSHLGAQWVAMNMTDGWQTVMAATISTTDGTERKQAYVDMVPYLQESGMYDVYLYTPACSSLNDIVSPGDNSTVTLPSNTCKDRGFVDVNMYFTSPEKVMTVTISQTNTVDKYDKIYSGMIMNSTPDFRPHVVVGPSISNTGTGGNGATQTVIVDSIQFVKEATLNNTHSLLFYRPGSSSVAVGNETKQASNEVHGLDSSVWGNLPTQLPDGAIVNSLVTYYGPTGSPSASSLLFIGGDFLGNGYTNLVAWNGTAFTSMAPGSPSTSGLDGVVYTMALYQSTLYVVGAFQQAYSSGAGATQLGGLAMYDIKSREWSSFGNTSQNFLPGAQFQTIQLSTGAEGQPQLILEGTFAWVQGTGTSNVSVAVWDINNQKWVREDLQANGNNSISDQSGFPFGYVRGHISYLNRVLGSNSNVTASTAAPVILIAGNIDSFDTYKVQQPENMAWLTSAGALKTVNLLPEISMAVGRTSNNTLEASAASKPIIGKVPEMPKTSAGVMYFNKDSQQWITIVGGAYTDGSIGAGYFNTPAFPSPSQDSILHYKDLDLTLAATSAIKGEIMALGIIKDEATGYISSDPANELLLIGGAFKGSGSSNVNGLALYDLAAGKVVSSSMVPILQGVQGRDPVVKVIKSQPGNARKMLVLAGEFSGFGDDLSCESICLWEPAKARMAMDKKKSIKGSFETIYGSKSKKHLGVLKGVVNDIAFEDDKNMFVAGDLVVNGIACGVASFNFEHLKWTTFGSMVNTTGGSSQPPSPDALTGPVTAIAHDSMFHRFFIAGRNSADGSAYFKKWDGMRFIRVSPDFMPTSDIHRLEILPASKDAPIRTATTTRHSFSSANDYNDNLNNDTPNTSSSSSVDPNYSSLSATSPVNPLASISSTGVDPNDTTQILEQGYILLVSGRIVIKPESSSPYNNKETQESSLAFFDGQSWFPYLQSSRNRSSVSLSPKSTKVALAKSHLNKRYAIGADLVERDASIVDSATASISSSYASTVASSPLSIRDQGVFRALAIAHLPRIVAREYLSLPYIILISIAISLGLILLIVLFGFLYVWMKRRLSKDKRASRPKFGSLVMKNRYNGYAREACSHSHGSTNGRRVGLKGSSFIDSLGVSQCAPFITNTNPSKNEKNGLFFFNSKSAADIKGGPESTSAIPASLNIAEAAANYEDPSSRSTGRRDANSSAGRLVYRPNPTIAQATDALVAQFVRSHQQSMASNVMPDSGKEEISAPSPDRRNKKSLHSNGLQSPLQDRVSSSSDLMNPLSQRRFSTLLVSTYDPNNPATPISKESTSPATTMTTPGGVVDTISTGAASEALVSGLDTNNVRNSGDAGGVFYYAKFQFRAREIGELGFKAGERILVVDMSDDIWWMGVIQDPNGHQVHGVFPSNYVGPTP